ncbi:hypothetical protein NL676_032589 [Syzygium grande]|nr:hypothetical protein NL676_032589 [Syzygium grande]
MDCNGLDENEARSRSFRHEDYNIRRAFLRSYPLHLGGEDQGNGDETVNVPAQSNKKKPMKKIILSVFSWGGGKGLVLRRFKNKLAVHVLACVPVGFKDPKILISS